MAVTLNPYLNFRDNAREAMTFYQNVFGGVLTTMTFSQIPMDVDPAEGDKIMHAQLTTDAGITLMAADTPNHMEYREAAGFSVSLSGDDEAALRGYFDKLAEGGTVGMPLNAAPWGDTFGMCTDQFGISWLVNIAGEANRPA